MAGSNSARQTLTRSVPDDRGLVLSIAFDFGCSLLLVGASAVVYAVGPGIGGFFARRAIHNYFVSPFHVIKGFMALSLWQINSRRC